MQMKVLSIFAALAVCHITLSSFCGFYVAQADTKLFNKASEVILVRDGNHTVITMSNDFQGDVKQFAMVVPVPVVLQREQIKVVEPRIFERMNQYSGPRLVEYHDESPCENKEDDFLKKSASGPIAMRMRDRAEAASAADGVKVEAEYKVGEYDIQILSAQESGGLETWLVRNGYSVPTGAKEVLTPYIRSNMKFFVVKVNLDRQMANGYRQLRPLQLRFDSPKFMLPIRLGMANANDYQDLIVYALSKNGRVETTNYRTVNIPTDQEIPTFVQPRFGEFYKAMFDRAWERQKDAVYNEYSWDISSSNFVKCDPCATEPPTLAELQEAGVDWVTAASEDQTMGGGANYSGDVFFTRLHVRYDRAHFPQDLQFQETRNRASFQGRYIMTHAAQSGLQCPEATEYLKKVYERRVREVANLAVLTGWPSDDRQTRYVQDFKERAERAGAKLSESTQRSALTPPDAAPRNWMGNPLIAGAFILAVVLGIFFLAERKSARGMK